MLGLSILPPIVKTALFALAFRTLRRASRAACVSYCVPASSSLAESTPPWIFLPILEGEDSGGDWEGLHHFDMCEAVVVKPSAWRFSGMSADIGYWNWRLFNLAVTKGSRIFPSNQFPHTTRWENNALLSSLQYPYKCNPMQRFAPQP